MFGLSFCPVLSGYARDNRSQNKKAIEPGTQQKPNTVKRAVLILLNTFAFIIFKAGFILLLGVVNNTINIGAVCGNDPPKTNNLLLFHIYSLQELKSPKTENKTPFVKSIQGFNQTTQFNFVAGVIGPISVPCKRAVFGPFLDHIFNHVESCNNSRFNPVSCQAYRITGKYYLLYTCLSGNVSGLKPKYIQPNKYGLICCEIPSNNLPVSGSMAPHKI